MLIFALANHNKFRFRERRVVRPSPIALALAAMALAAAGCGPLPPARHGVLDVDISPRASSPDAIDGERPGNDERGSGEGKENATGEEWVVLGLALRQEMPDEPRERAIICHVDLVLGERIVGFFNTRERRRPFADRLTRTYIGAFRERDWLDVHRPYYLRADAARRAVVKGKRMSIITIFISTRVPAEEAARIEAVLDRRRDARAPYRLAGRNCATRLAEILIEAGWLPQYADGGPLPGIDRPIGLTRRFAARAAPGRLWMARGYFNIDADGKVRVESPN